jgi:hypothetical protein
MNFLELILYVDNGKLIIPREVMELSRVLGGSKLARLGVFDLQVLPKCF